MEEPELRVGGWVQQKKRGKIRRLFSFLLIVIVGLLVGGPMFVDYNAVEVQSSSLYKNAGVWNGPFGQENIKEFNGHLKISKTTYESSDGYSGKLIILSLNSFVSLDYLNKQDIIVNKIIVEMDKEGLKLGTGSILTEVNENLPQNTLIYQWKAVANEDNQFFDNEEEVFVKTFSWTNTCTNGILCNPETIICIALAKDLNNINQATELIENVG